MLEWPSAKRRGTYLPAIPSTLGVPLARSPSSGTTIDTSPRFADPFFPPLNFQLTLSCGLENELLSVTEPEKCEYHIAGKTPALCWPLDDSNDAGVKQEL